MIACLIRKLTDHLVSDSTYESIMTHLKEVASQ